MKHYRAREQRCSGITPAELKNMMHTKHLVKVLRETQASGSSSSHAFRVLSTPRKHQFLTSSLREGHGKGV